MELSTCLGRYILLSGKQPFYGTNNKEIFKQVQFWVARTKTEGGSVETRAAVHILMGKKSNTKYICMSK